MNQWLQWHFHPETGPKRILTLDGGGVRGLITLGILQHIEQILASRNAKPEDFRLAHYFDLIAGTSTGSIIATALALGMKVEEVKRLYLDLSPAAFATRGWGLFRTVYDPRPLEKKLREILGSETFESDKLLTGLMICAKRMDTGSPWVLTNCRDAKYWGPPSNNKEYELWRLVRASTAAPLYFEPIKVLIEPATAAAPAQMGVFIDGGVGGFNNPSWQALATATLPAYGFNWTRGAQNLFIVSVGTGWWRMRSTVDEYMGLDPWQQASRAISSMIQDSVLHVITAMQAASTPRKPWRINGEIENMRNPDGSAQKVVDQDVLAFQRYDAMVEADSVSRLFRYPSPSKELKLALDELRNIGNTDKQRLAQLYELGFDAGHVTRPGVDGVEPADFPAHFDPPFMRQATA